MDDLQAAASLKDFVESNLQNVEVKDEHKGYIHFHVQSPSTPWSTLFRVMEDAKKGMSPTLEEYSISQTTLEQVFLNFAKKQSTNTECPKENFHLGNNKFLRICLLRGIWEYFGVLNTSGPL